VVAFSYTLYNVKLDPAGNPNLTIQMNLFQDGKMVTEGKPAVTKIEKQDDLTRIQDYAKFRISPNQPLGEYVLQLIVTDKLATGRGAVATQSIDFEIIE
jgi:hypothetical protein